MIWLQSLLKEMKYFEPQNSVLFIDSIYAKYLTANFVMHARMKHVKIDFNCIWNLVFGGMLDVTFLEEKVANMMRMLDCYEFQLNLSQDQSTNSLRKH